MQSEFQKIGPVDSVLLLKYIFHQLTVSDGSYRKISLIARMASAEKFEDFLKFRQVHFFLSVFS